MGLAAYEIVPASVTPLIQDSLQVGQLPVSWSESCSGPLSSSQPREPSKNTVAGNGSLSAAQAQAVADEYDVPVEAVEAVADKLTD
ncbi:hypothetical protein GCM10009067_26580 [Haloarcula sebkhae]|uniref:Uncharacterized protein n=1 Tax=Haloarcula sebkhae TaxID=932660 RepID=A0A830F0H4_9EURY|nr:hypothetical protein GCM10009067_26580 [Haloarcula sebkhae]